MKDVYKHTASLTKRGLAFLADLIIIDLVLFTPFQSLIPSQSFEENLKLLEKGIPPQIYILAISISLLSLLYFTVFEYWLRQTPGMMLLGIYADGKMTFFKSLIRNLYIIPFFPFFLLWIIEPVYLFFRQERWLERITQTSTVELERYAP